MKRREIFLLPSAIVVSTALLPSCNKKGELTKAVVNADEALKKAADELPPEVKPFLRQVGLVTIRYGIKTAKMQHWALRLLGASLILTGALVIRYVRGDNGKNETWTIKLEEAEVQKLEQERKLTTVREDGGEETFPITEVKMQTY